MSVYSVGDTTLYKLDATRPPQADETGELEPNVHYVQGGIFWVQFEDRFWCCVDSNDVSALVFVEVSAIGQAPDGWELNSVRGYSSQSRSFDTNYTPSETNDTFVIFPFSQASVALGSATVTLLVDGVTIDIKSCSGLVTTRQDSFAFICPKGKVYRVNSSTTGIGSSNTAGNVKEVLL